MRLKRQIELIKKNELNQCSPEEKAELYEWFEHAYNQEVADSQVESVGQRVKSRLDISIKKDKPYQIIKMAKAIAVAASLICIFYLSYRFWPNEKEILLNNKELAQIKPNPSGAYIELADGQVVDLQNMDKDAAPTLSGNHLKMSENEVSYFGIEHNSEEKEPKINKLVTKKGTQYTVKLSDGTVVVLNANSKLTYPSFFKANEKRMVELEGEGFFEVAHINEKSRFTVKTKGQEVEVLGTKFNLKIDSEMQQTETVLIEGSVQLSSIGRDKILLKPGQQAILHQGNIKVNKADLTAALSWKDGWFYFNGKNTNHTLKEIADWYDVDLKLPVSGIKNTFKGRIPRSLSLDKIIALLNFAKMDVKAIKKNNQIELIIN